MAYVPPYRRKDQNDSSSEGLRTQNPRPKWRITAKSHFYSPEEIGSISACSVKSLNTLTVSTISHQSPPDAVGVDPSPSSQISSETIEKEIKQKSVTEDDNGRDTLRCVIIYNDQHPEWDSDHKIFCKSNLHALPQSSGSSEEDNETIREIELPVYQEVPFMFGDTKQGSRYEFIGWWKLKDVEYLEPHSRRLVDYFKLKFNSQVKKYQRRTVKKRSEEAWEAGLAMKWALITLEQNHSRKDLPITPSVENYAQPQND